MLKLEYLSFMNNLLSSASWIWSFSFLKPFLCIKDLHTRVQFILWERRKICWNCTFSQFIVKLLEFQFSFIWHHWPPPLQTAQSDKSCHTQAVHTFILHVVKAEFLFLFLFFIWLVTKLGENPSSPYLVWIQCPAHVSCLAPFISGWRRSHHHGNHSTNHTTLVWYHNHHPHSWEAVVVLCLLVSKFDNLNPKLFYNTHVWK